MKSKKGFTLIELLIVITIIGILAVAFLPSLLGAPAKARDTQRITGLQKVATVLSTKSLTGNLPKAAGVFVAKECVTESGLTLNLADFGGKLPVDPSGLGHTVTAAGKLCDGTYVYVKNPNNSNNYAFGLYAHVENWENGNFKCPTDTGVIIAGQEDVIITPPSNAADLETYCYGILIQ